MIFQLKIILRIVKDSGRFLVTKESNLSDNDLKVTKNVEKIDEMKSLNLFLVVSQIKKENKKIIQKEEK